MKKQNIIYINIPIFSAALNNTRHQEHTGFVLSHAPLVINSTSHSFIYACPQHSTGTYGLIANVSVTWISRANSS